MKKIQKLLKLSFIAYLAFILSGTYSTAHLIADNIFIHADHNHKSESFCVCGCSSEADCACHCCKAEKQKKASSLPDKNQKCSFINDPSCDPDTNTKSPEISFKFTFGPFAGHLFEYNEAEYFSTQKSLQSLQISPLLHPPSFL